MRLKTVWKHYVQEPPSRCVALGVCLIFSLVHILFFHNQFFDINRSKYYLLIYGVEAAGLVVGAYLALEKPWRGTLRRPGLATSGLLLLMLSVGASLLLTNNWWTAMTGSEGRYAGGFFFASLGLLYALGRWALAGSSPKAPARASLPTPAELILCALLVSGSLCALLGVVNFLGWDPLGFYVSLRSVYHNDFISTIGNRNFFSAYMCLTASLAAGLFLRWKHRARPLMLAAFLLSYLGVLASHSDSGFVGLAALGLATLAYPLRRKREVLRLLVLPGSACLATCVLGELAAARGQAAMDYSDCVAGLLLDMPVLMFFLGAAIIVLAVWLGNSPYLTHRVEFSRLELARMLILICVGACLAACGILMIYYTHINPLAQPPAAFLRMDDHWGTFRGFIWRKTVSLWSGLSPMQKLFGIGPDSYRALLEQTCHDEMIALTGLVFDSAHNECLHLLITVGLLGLAGYLMLYAGALWTAWRAGRRNPAYFAAFVALCAHLAQSMFNIAQPETTPAVFLVLAVAMSGAASVQKATAPAAATFSESTP